MKKPWTFQSGARPRAQNSFIQPYRLSAAASTTFFPPGKLTTLNFQLQLEPPRPFHLAFKPFLQLPIPNSKLYKNGPHQKPLPPPRHPLPGLKHMAILLQTLNQSNRRTTRHPRANLRRPHPGPSGQDDPRGSRGDVRGLGSG